MNVVEITAEQAEQVATYGEDHFYDRKSFMVKPATLTKLMSAFANADGGELFVGIEDDGRWAGAEDVEAFNGHVQAMEELFPYGTEVDYEFLKHAEQRTLVLHATIQKSREVKVASNGRAYVRRGAQSLPGDEEELSRQKGLTTHETARLAYAIDQISNSETTINFMLNVVPATEPDAWLEKQQLIVDGLPTIAGTVLFHDEPQVHVPKASVKLYRYTSSESEGTREELAFDPIAIEGPVYDVIHEAVTQTVAQVESIPLLDKTSGLTSVSYPAETLHEIITNAVIHRDYAVHDDVHVRIFDDRIEVESPGRLPANITPQNILDRRFSRNPVIVRIINKFPNPPNKDVGEGLNTAFRAMRNLNLRDPEIKDRETSVLVVIRHESLASAEERIVQYLKANESINNREARRLLNRPEAERSVRRLFEKLVEGGEIERVPGTERGGSRYRLRLRPEAGAGDDG